MPNYRITGKDYEVHRAFSDNFNFKIPHYQRPYSWGIDHASALVDDLLNAYRISCEKQDHTEPYFLGSVVLIKSESMPDSQVVDGQQRLTTLTILYSVIREIAQSWDKPSKSERDFVGAVERRIVEIGDETIGTKDRYRLSLRHQDQEFFQKYIQTRGGVNKILEIDYSNLTDAQQNILLNTKKIYSMLKNDVSRDELRGMVRYLNQNCTIVIVSTPDMGSAYKIFSILNDRGMDLYTTDILKSEVIGNIADKADSFEYADKWVQMEDSIGRDNFRDFFSHIRMIVLKRKARNILKEFQDEIKPQDNPKVFIDNTLSPMVEAYTQILHSKYFGSQEAKRINHNLRWLNKIDNFDWIPQAKRINHNLRWLNKIDNFDWIPPAILYLSKHQTEPTNLAVFFEALERLASGLMIMRANVNDRIERYSRLLKTIEKESVIKTTTPSIDFTDDEKDKIKEQLSGNIYQVRAIVKYVLLRLDESLSSGEATYEYPVISVEHVLPQNPAEDSQWIKWFPKPEQREEWVHRLANLVLLSKRKNVQAYNYEFEKKKEKYFITDTGISPFSLTTQVIQKQIWEPNILKIRQENLLQELYNLWKLN